jgi:hypothetical protein
MHETIGLTPKKEEENLMDQRCRVFLNHIWMTAASFLSTAPSETATDLVDNVVAHQALQRKTHPKSYYQL